MFVVVTTRVRRGLNMAEKIPVPVYDTSRSVTVYERDVTAWELVTKVEKKDRAIILTLNFDNALRQQVLQDCNSTDLNKDEGVKALLTYLKT